MSAIESITSLGGATIRMAPTETTLRSAVTSTRALGRRHLRGRGRPSSELLVKDTSIGRVPSFV
jgi:hypothetical protein